MKIGLTQAVFEQRASDTNSHTLASISAWIKQEIPDVQVIYSTDINELLDCDEVWCTTTSDAWGKTNELGKIITEHGKKFLVGGHHATALPQTLKYGTAFRGQIETFKHLDELPLPDWTIFRESKAHMLMTSRGCPFDCNFCSSKSFWGRYYAKTAGKVIEEIRYLHNLGANYIIIFDDLFTANNKRLEEISNAICEEGLSGIQYSCLVRSDTIDQKTIEFLKKMNVILVSFGAESGSDEVLALMNKKTKASDNQRAIDLLNENGLKPTISLIAGYPGESPKDLELTRQFIDKNRKNCHAIVVYPCIPFPGTRLWSYFTERYHIESLDNFDWESLNVEISATNWDKYFMLTDEYPKEQLIDLITWNEAERNR